MQFNKRKAVIYLINYLLANRFTTETRSIKDCEDEIARLKSVPDNDVNGKIQMIIDQMKLGTLISSMSLQDWDTDEGSKGSLYEVCSHKWV